MIANLSSDTDMPSVFKLEIQVRISARSVESQTIFVLNIYRRYSVHLEARGVKLKLDSRTLRKKNYEKGIRGLCDYDARELHLFENATKHEVWHELSPSCTKTPSVISSLNSSAK